MQGKSCPVKFRIKHPSGARINYLPHFHLELNFVLSLQKMRSSQRKAINKTNLNDKKKNKKERKRSVLSFQIIRKSI